MYQYCATGVFHNEKISVTEKLVFVLAVKLFIKM